jgi:hypothetical protein
MGTRPAFGTRNTFSMDRAQKWDLSPNYRLDRLCGSQASTRRRNTHALSVDAVASNA